MDNTINIGYVITLPFPFDESYNYYLKEHRGLSLASGKPIRFFSPKAKDAKHLSSQEISEANDLEYHCLIGDTDNYEEIFEALQGNINVEILNECICNDEALGAEEAELLIDAVGSFLEKNDQVLIQRIVKESQLDIQQDPNDRKNHIKNALNAICLSYYSEMMDLQVLHASNMGKTGTLVHQIATCLQNPDIIWGGSTGVGDIQFTPPWRVYMNVTGANYIVAQGQEAVNEIIKIFSDEDKDALKQKIPVIPRGVDVDQFLPGEKTVADKPLSLITVSRLVTRKGIDTVLEAIKLLKDQYGRNDIKLKIIGEGNDGQRLRNLCNDLAIDGQVEFCGAVLHSQIPSYLQAADAFVLTPYSTEKEKEGVPNVGMEALASGLPIITSDAVDYSTNIMSGEEAVECIFTVPEQNPAKLAACINDQLKDSETCATFSVAARSIAERCFDYKTNHAKYFGVIYSAYEGRNLEPAQQSGYYDHCAVVLEGNLPESGSR